MSSPPASHDREDPTRLSTLHRLIATLGVLLAFAIAVGSLSPPAAVGGGADPREFSGARAVTRLGQVLGDQRPHPVGSIAADEVRARLVSTLEELGADVEVVTSFACTANGRRCAHLDNVIATLGQPSTDQPAVLLASHYDSVHAGPGAGDDGAGVAATLEILSAWQARGAPWPVVALFDEGEEVGLLGAQAFVDEPSSLDNIGVVFNLEARGTTGRVSMFETKGEDAPWVRRYGAVVGDKYTNSLSAEVYRRMPNDTDLTVFGTTALPGLNFAMIDGVARYHSDRDDLAHLDPRSVQHMGDQVLALVDSLPTLGWPGGDPSESALAYLDIVGIWLLRWPESWSLWICAIVTLLSWWALVRSAFVTTRSFGATVRRSSWALGCVILAPAIAFAMASAVHAFAAAYLQTSAPGYAFPAPLRVGIVLSSLVAWWWCASLSRPHDALPQKAGLALLATLAFALSWTAPGASPVFILAPAFAMAGDLMFRRRASAHPLLYTFTTCLPATVAMIVLVPTFHAFDLAFGPSPAPMLAVFASVILWTCPTPWCSDLRLNSAIRRGLLSLPLFVLVSAWSIQVPAFNDDAPQALSLHRIKAVTPNAEPVAILAWGGWGPRAPLPDAVAEDTTWSTLQETEEDLRALTRRLPGGVWYQRPTTPSSAPPPKLDYEFRDDGTSVLTIRSRRGANMLVLDLDDSGASIVEVDGEPVPGETSSLTLFGARDGAATIVVRRVDSTLRCTVADIVSGAHPLDAERLAARPSWASPRQWGDRHVVYEAHTLTAPAP